MICNVFIATVWQTMDTIERIAEEKNYPLQDSAMYKRVNRMINRLAKAKGTDESLKFRIAYLLGKLSERVKEV